LNLNQHQTSARQEAEKGIGLCCFGLIVGRELATIDRDEIEGGGVFEAFSSMDTT